MTRWFWLIFMDDDKKTFNVGGPSTDDTLATDRTARLQQAGRHVRLSTTTPVPSRERLPSLESVVADGVAGYGHDPSLRW